MFSVEKVEKDRLILQAGGERIGISRYCTHEGGDLSLGHIKDGVIHCPLHNLRFCLKTGKQPCKTLKNLEVTCIQA